jgi:serine protease Do
MSALLAAPAATVRVFDDADPLPKRSTVTSRLLAGVARAMFVLAALALTMLGFVLGAPSGHAASQPQVDQQVNQSLVYISTQYKAFVQIPGADEDDGQPTWSKSIVVDFSCSGVIVDPAGYIATAGHCVDPNNPETKQAIYQQLFVNLGMSDDDVNHWTNKAIQEEWPIEGQNPATPADRNVQVIQPQQQNGDKRVVDTFTTVQVVDFQTGDQGDNALLKIANEPALPALPVADKAPTPGTSLISVGFPGDIGGAMDASRLQAPSFKDGTASSSQVTPSGATSTEISATISSGMSGGPTVDATTGEVLGLNDYTITDANGQASDFITDASALRAFLVKNNVHLVVPSAPAQPFPWMWVAVGGAAVVVLLAVPVVLVLRRGAKRRSVRPIDGSQLLQPTASAQPAPQQSMAHPQSPGGSSEPAREERSDAPVTAPAEHLSTAPPLLTPSTNGAVEIK